MSFQSPKIKRPVALVILDGWGYAPRTEGNAIAIAHTPYYDEICRNFPMTTLAAAGTGVGEPDGQLGSAEVGYLNMGTGRVAQTEVARIQNSIATGDFLENDVLNRAFTKAKASGAGVHIVGLLSDSGVHSSIDNLFATVRLAKRHELSDVFIHCILDGLDTPERTADIFAEALEIKLADIGTGKIATLCGRFFAMDSSENWERTARAFTMLVHAEGERTFDPVTSIRNSFLRGISDEFIAPIVVEKAPDMPLTTVKDGDLVVFFNHRADGMRQLVRSLCISGGTTGAKPVVDAVCLTEYDHAFNLPAAFRQEPEKNTLVQVLSGSEIPNIKITESSRLMHMTRFFDGGNEFQQQFERQIVVTDAASFNADIPPESQSFRITDTFRRGLEASANRVFVVDFPAADMMADTGDLTKTVEAIQYIDTCLGGICEKTREMGGVVMITATHGNCEDMVHDESGQPNPMPTANPVPFHYVDYDDRTVRLQDGRSLEDIAPTILGILEIEKPEEMTGMDIRCV